MPIQQLTELTISGADAYALLQGQLTYHLDTLTTTYAFAAQCNREGRVITLFFIRKIPEGYTLLLPSSMLDIALAALKKYAVFYKVKMEARPSPLTAWPQIVPMIYPVTSAQFCPHDLHLHHYQAISFDKGCFTGQEIIARMHYRGKLKNHLYPVHIPAPHHPQPGMLIYAEGNICGTFISPYLTTVTHIEGFIVTDDKSINSPLLFLENNPEARLSPLGL